MAANPFDQQNAIPGVKKIIAVSSGKGGVGKSTVSINLAVSLARMGHKVGLLDADIYGPSLPRMAGAINQKVELRDDKTIAPLERYGVKMMSIGFLVEEDLAIVWRGPMLFKAMDQFLREVAWGELDYLLVDMPPGTGDIQLSLAQKVPVVGAVAVSTPQDIALADVKKAIDMWSRVSVPVLGVVENMSWMTLPSGDRVPLFPRGQMDAWLRERGIRKLGEIPFNTTVAVGAEAGVPIVQSKPDSGESKAFTAVAQSLIELTKN